MRYILLLSIAMCLAVAVQAQDSGAVEPPYNRPKHAVGLAGGVSTGAGFSYRYWPGKSGFQVNFIPFFDGGNTIVALGGAYLHRIIEGNHVNLYGYAGAGLFFESYDTNYSTFNIGGGPAFEWLIRDVVSINAMFGLGLQDLSREIRLGPTGEVGVYYAF